MLFPKLSWRPQFTLIVLILWFPTWFKSQCKWQAAAVDIQKSLSHLRKWFMNSSYAKHFHITHFDHSVAGTGAWPHFFFKMRCANTRTKTRLRLVHKHTQALFFNDLAVKPDLMACLSMLRVSLCNEKDLWMFRRIQSVSRTAISQSEPWLTLSCLVVLFYELMYKVWETLSPPCGGKR